MSLIGGHPLSSLVAAALMLAALYALGSFAMSRLYALALGSAASRAAFYAFVAPGVVLHEVAHALACVLTLTPIRGFAPFRPERRKDGGLELGHVRHDRRSSPIEAVIGLAPVVANPSGIIVVSAIFLEVGPLYVFELPALGVLEAVADRTLEQPLAGAVWAYVAGSLALGSVPSRSDLSSLPAVLLVLVVVAFAATALGPADTDFTTLVPGAIPVLAAAGELATKLYALPVLVGALAAAVAWLAWRSSAPT